MNKNYWFMAGQIGPKFPPAVQGGRQTPLKEAQDQAHRLALDIQ